MIKLGAGGYSRNGGGGIVKKRRNKTENTCVRFRKRPLLLRERSVNAEIRFTIAFAAVAAAA